MFFKASNTKSYPLYLSLIDNLVSVNNTVSSFFIPYLFTNISSLFFSFGFIKKGSIQLLSTKFLQASIWCKFAILSLVKLLTDAILSQASSIILCRLVSGFQTSIPCAIKIIFVDGFTFLISQATKSKLIWLKITISLFLPSATACFIKVIFAALYPQNISAGK